MGVRRIVQRSALKERVKTYKTALRGAKRVIDAQEAELRKFDPTNLIIAPTSDQVIQVNR